MCRFSLELHPDTTWLILLGRFAAKRRREQGKGKPKTFNFLGFTPICGKTRQGKSLLMRRTMRKRWNAKLREVKAWLRFNRHQSIPDQGRWLGAVVRGHYAYYGVPTNVNSLRAFCSQVERHWLHALRRRGQKHRLNWEGMRRIAKRWLPFAANQNRPTCAHENRPTTMVLIFDISAQSFSYDSSSSRFFLAFLRILPRIWALSRGAMNRTVFDKSDKDACGP